LSEVSLPASRQGGHRLQVKVLDLGTGSGCIAITLAKQFPAADILACDISEAALEVASLNAGLHGVKIEFKKSDLFAACNLISDTCDLIVSNPPYIASGDFKDLQPEISYEPPVALNAGEDGLDLYRRIIKEAPPYLKSRGFLLMELGFAQAGPVKKIFHRKNNFKIIETVRDYNNIERVIVAQKEG
jgi:release factor glutamine methyltransferase